MINIVLTDDHQVVRSGIKMLFEQVHDIAIVGEAGDGEELLQLLSTNIQVDIILIDLNLPKIDGLTLISRLKHHYPKVKMIVLSMADHETYIMDAFNNGASGYLLKNVDLVELASAIRKVYYGYQYVCAELGLQMFYKVLNENKKKKEFKTSTIIELNSKEEEVLLLIAEGYSNQEIANQLFTSKRTIEGYRLNILSKMGVKNTAALIRNAFRAGLIT
jgi:two-component system response regulator NreC